MRPREARQTRARPDAAGRRRGAGCASVVLAALVLTLLNASKPLAVDDAAYHTFAVHIAESPADPYGFEMVWGERPLPAFEILAPPLLLYWWAGAIRIFGEQPVLWKLSLLPFALLLAAALHDLLRRFARGLEQPLLWLLLLSPAVLPSFNLMLDVPALALGLASLALFMRACDGGRLGQVAAAGLLAGLAMQTKYSAFSAVAALLAYGAVFSHLRRALLAAALAGCVFAGWELLMALQYGESHFLHARASRDSVVSLRGIGFLSAGFLSLVGGVAPAAGALGLIGLSARRSLVAGAILLGSLVFAVIPALPADPLPQLAPSPKFDDAPAERILFTALGCGILLVAAAVFRSRLARRAPSPPAVHAAAEHAGFAARRPDLFLLAWTLLELLGCYAVWTFPAGRRVLGLATVLTLACGRAAAARLPRGRNRSQLHCVATWGVGLGLLYFAADLSDAMARRDATRLAAAELETLGADPARERVWYVGHWGFGFYAARLGLQPVVPGRSRLEAGDWLVVPEGVSRQNVWIPASRVRRAGHIESRSRWPWSTIPSYYAGPTPLRSQPDAQVAVRLYRVQQDFVAAERRKPRVGRRQRRPARR